ncbi:hypothetical protein FRB97_005404, partial [Tulasnella sp. 331]
MERGLIRVMRLYGMEYMKSTSWALNKVDEGRPEPGLVEVMEEVTPEALRIKLNKEETPWAVRSDMTQW